MTDVSQCMTFNAIEQSFNANQTSATITRPTEYF